MYFNMDIKLKTRAGFQNSVLHNHRKEKEPKDNIDYSRTKDNYYIIGSNDENYILSSHIEETEKSRLQKTGKIKAIRKDANVAISFVFSASPEHFFDFERSKMTREKWEALDISNGEKDKAKIAEVWKTLKKEKVKEFEEIIIQHLKEVHKENIINLQCHLDEKGVHFHGLVSCRVDTPKGKKLSAKEYYTRTTLAEWNKDIRARMKKIGLEAKKEEPMPPIPTNEHHTEQAPEIPKGTQRPKVQKPNKILGLHYPNDEVEKAFETYEQRERALKKDNATLLKMVYENNNYRVNYKNLQKQNKELSRENKRMKNKIYNMTEQEKEDLRSIPCSEVLEALGYRGTPEGTTTRYKAEGLNLVVTEASNKFFDNKTMMGGYGAIDLLINQFRYSFKEAIDFLSGKFSAVEIAKVASRAKPEDVAKVLEEAVEEFQKLPDVGKEYNFERVKDYLTVERKISPKIVDHLVKNNLLYADRKNNCVFTNEQRTFAFLRGTVKGKKFVANKGKLDFIKYNFQKEQSKENVFLFESAIDALSFFTLTKKQGSYIVLNGSGMINKINDLKLQDYNNVYCCFDKDEQGNKFDVKIKEALPTSNVVILKPNLKDFNEDLTNGNATTFEQYTATGDLANSEAIARKTSKIARNPTDRDKQVGFKIR